MSSFLDAMMRDMITKPTREVWTHHGLPPDDIERITLGTAPDPSINSPFKLGTAAQTAVGLSALAATHFHELRTGVVQDVRIDPRHALIEFNGERYYTIDGKLPNLKKGDGLTGVYKAKDGWVHLNANLSQDKERLVDLLKCEPTRESFAAALAEWDASQFINAILERGLCAAELWSFSSIDGHFQGRSTVNISPVIIRRIGDAPRRATTSTGVHPLHGVRVLEVAYALAGPLAGRTLAAHGADVLSVTKGGTSNEPDYDIMAACGKRMTQLNLSVPEQHETLIELLRDADVLLQEYRPNSPDAYGHGVADVAELRPGVVYASISAFSHTSPYKDRIGYAEEIEFVGGYAVQEAESYKEWVDALEEDSSEFPPYRLMPLPAIEHLAGQFLAFGIMVALSKTITEGGSWEVRVSLESVALWLRHLGLLSAAEAHGEGRELPPRVLPLNLEVEALSISLEQDGNNSSDSGRMSRKSMTVVRHAAMLEATPVREGQAPIRLDWHNAKWLSRT